jgi:hypothetical protein
MTIDTPVLSPRPGRAVGERNIRRWRSGASDSKLGPRVRCNGRWVEGPLVSLSIRVGSAIYDHADDHRGGWAALAERQAGPRTVEYKEKLRRDPVKPTRPPKPPA